MRGWYVLANINSKDNEYVARGRSICAIHRLLCENNRSIVCAPIYRSRNHRWIAQQSIDCSKQLARSIEHMHVNSNALVQSIDCARVRKDAKAWCLDCFAFQCAVATRVSWLDMDRLFKARMTSVANSKATIGNTSQVTALTSTSEIDESKSVAPVDTVSHPSTSAAQELSEVAGDEQISMKNPSIIPPIQSRSQNQIVVVY